MSLYNAGVVGLFSSQKVSCYTFLDDDKTDLHWRVSPRAYGLYSCVEDVLQWRISRRLHFECR
jgi:hypothetical protein